MTTIAVTGHRGLPAPTTRLVDAAVRAELARHDPDHLTGWSCLADGADSLFARAVLDRGGELVVVVPAEEYRDGLPTAHHPEYDALIARARDVVRLDRRESDAEAHMQASLRMLDAADEVMAVWDGEPARGYGGTADVVSAACDAGLPVRVIWPAGATRD